MDPSALPINSGLPQDQNLPSTGGGISKEIETGKLTVETSALKEVSSEIELPPEVTGAGVRSQPTTVNLPPQASQMGVTPVGQANIGVAPKVALPLTDDQIADGLKQSITSSWRWLAEWCWKKLKQLHLTIKSIAGKNVEVRK